MRKPATERLPVGAPCLRCGPLPLFSPQQALSAVRPSNDSLSDKATDNREVREADPSPRPRIRNGFSSPASKDGGFQARNFCKGQSPGCGQLLNTTSITRAIFHRLEKVPQTKAYQKSLLLFAGTIIMVRAGGSGVERRGPLRSPSRAISWLFRHHERTHHSIHVPARSKSVLLQAIMLVTTHR